MFTKKRTSYIIVEVDMKRQDGMTLLELMFAAGILAFVLSMIFTSVITMGANGEIQAQRLQAESVVNEVLDQISRTDKSQILNFQPDVPNLPGTNANIQIEVIGSTGPIQLPVNGQNVNLPDPLEVRVTLTWETTRGYVITKRGSTYVSN